MKNAFVFTISLFALSLGVNAFAADRFNVDPSHSSVVFKVNHMGFSNVYGMFGDISGDFQLDDKGSDSNVNIYIQVASLDTKAAKRDEHLKKPDFFDAKQFPTITFKSTSVKKQGSKYTVKGNLTMHGVTKPLSFELTRFRTGETPDHKTHTGGETKFKIKRSDFGMNFLQGPNMVGDEIEIWVSLEGVLQT